MKLWQKIFLITLAFVIAAVSVTAEVVLSNYFSAAIEREKENDIAAHEYYAASISNRVAYERLKSGEMILSEDKINSIITNMLSSQSKSDVGIALYDDNGSVGSIQAQVISKVENFIDMVKNSDKGQTIITEYNEGTYLIAGSQITLEGVTYYMFTCNNITEIYNIYNEQFNFIKIISIIFAVVTALILLIIVFKLLSPLTKVNASIKNIADGDYSMRIESKGGNEFKELAGNVNVMAEAIESNIKDLQSVADSRKRFIDNFAHEMKTPLTSIICLSDVLRIKKKITDTERMEYSGIIFQEAKRLKVLSGKLLELTIAGNAQLEFVDTNISELLDEIKGTVTPILQKRSMSISVKSLNVTIQADRELFKSLLLNLIDNAIKASDHGQTISVECSLKDNLLTISVSDNGVGMSKEEIRKITEPFYMVDKSRSRKEGGAGLGLSLCVEIAKRHNAKLNIESTPGKGTTVYIIIPVTGGSRDE